MSQLTKSAAAIREAADMAWDFRDEEQYAFIEKKYGNRRALWEAAQQARREADGKELKDGQPNPQHRRLVLEAEMATMRFEMAYVIDKNKQLQQIIEPLEFVFQRLTILEGAYGHVKLLAETAKTDYILTTQHRKKEQKDG